MNIEPVKLFFESLQASIVTRLGQLEPHPFRFDPWARTEGGGGIACVLENGQVFERAAINFSHVFGGVLPASASMNRPQLAGRKFEALGVSLVLHPLNPYVPTVHMNTRFLVATDENDSSIWWFGGGMDLTPYYGFQEDAVHFHQTCQLALAPFGEEYYPRFKTWCDTYFFLKHRNEPRGIGGIFFDDLHEPSFEPCFNLTKAVGQHFLPAYLPILERRINTPFGERERDFQAYRRGRYVEFNLVYDRGTLFGLQSGGRTESILMSLPPHVKWRYDWKPQAGSAEDKLYSEFLVHKTWL